MSLLAARKPKFQCSGFKGEGSGFRGERLGFRDEGLGFGVQDLGLRAGWQFEVCIRLPWFSESSVASNLHGTPTPPAPQPKAYGQRPKSPGVRFVMSRWSPRGFLVFVAGGRHGRRNAASLFGDLHWHR